MKKLITIVLFGIFLFCLIGCQKEGLYEVKKEENSQQFLYTGNYVKPELVVDGIMDEEEWKNGTEELHFGVPEESDFRATLRFYRGENSLYAFFEVKDTNLLTQGNNNGDDVTKSDSVELYLDTLNDGSTRPQTDDFQFNIGIHQKTRILIANKGSWGAWNGLIDYAVSLNGTANNPSDRDRGYSVELMIPYAQTNMTKNSTFGFALGHVDKYGANPTEYEWKPLLFRGEFVDPQSPAKYVVCQGNKFFARGEEDLDNVTISGKCFNQLKTPLANVNVAVKGTDNTVMTNEKGEYTLKDINPNVDQTLVFTLGSMKTERAFSISQLRSSSSHQCDVAMLDTTIPSQTTIKGTVSNLVYGKMENANVSLAGKSCVTDKNGDFTLLVDLKEKMEIKIALSGFIPYVKVLPLEEIVVDGETSLGEISLNNRPATFVFGGNRGINLVNAEVSRSLDGVFFEFTSYFKFPGASHIELFINTKGTGSTDQSRTKTDYRIDFAPNGTISIVNFGNGNNTDVPSSGITCQADNNSEKPVIKAFIPYAFLGVTNKEIFGFSAGVWSGSDWDGFAFNDEYVAPEITEKYVRLGLDNKIYQYKTNAQLVTITGVVLGNDQPITGAKINDSIVTDALGQYTLQLEYQENLSFTVSKDGYQTKTVVVNLTEYQVTVTKDVTLQTTE